MQRIAVAAQGADGEALIVQLLLELFQLLLIVEHRQLAMRIAGIIASAQLNRVDVELLELLENFFKRKLR